ncbi:MAG: hypothetical protein Q9178_001420 [Gyalolechia marmorata]
MFAPLNPSIRKRLGIDGIWAGYLPVVLLSVGVFEVVMLSGQILQYLVQNGSSLTNQIKAMSYDFQHQRYYKPFLREKPIIIESRDQMEELSHTPELSQPAVYADIFGFKYTLKDEETNTDPLDTAGARFRLFARTIKVIGTTELQQLQPHLQGKIVEVLEQAIRHGLAVGNGWVSVETTPTMRDTASDPLALYMFGRTLTENPKFMGSLKRYLFSRTTKDGQALKDLIVILKSAMAKPEGGWEEDESLRKNLDFAFLELCQRPEYLDLIRKEVANTATLDVKSISNEMPILDSFLKESMRLNPMDDLAIRRKSLSAYTFRSGTPHIPTGAITSVSSYNLMHDPHFYPAPNTFDGLRYTHRTLVDTDDGIERENRMYGDSITEVKREFPVWGFGGHVCPGRYHAALVMKMVVIYLVREYEFQLEEPGKPWKWWWDNLAMPYAGTRVLVRKRKE